MSSKNNKDLNTKWNSRLEEVRAFAQLNDRWPSTSSDDASEKKLGQWWSRQKNAYHTYKNKGKCRGMNSERAIAVSSLINSFILFERDGEWMRQYNKVKRRIENYGRLWPYGEKNKENQKTKQWWNLQKTFCRKFLKGEEVGGMTKERAALIESLQEKTGESIVIGNSVFTFKEILGFRKPN